MARASAQRWLLLFNCQADGLATCLELLNPSLVVDRYDALKYRENARQIGDTLDSYDRIVIAPRVKHLVDDEVLHSPAATWLPHVWFQGYHPDLCYLAGNTGALSRGPLGGYHSVIAYSAYETGLDVASTVDCFNARTYEALGYFDFWGHAKAQLLDSFASHGFDLRENFVRWSRSGPFMHSVNHPKIVVLGDIARLLLLRSGLGVRESGIIPHDNLTNGPVFPVYPEIGARLGVGGSYEFKGGGRYRTKDLEKFVSESFAVYRNAGEERPSNEAFFPILEKARAFMASIREKA